MGSFGEVQTRPDGMSLVEGSGPGADSPETGPEQGYSGAGGGGAVVGQRVSAMMTRRRWPLGLPAGIRQFCTTAIL